MTAATEILRLLECNTAAGAYLSQVFTDWLDLSHATLSALPNDLASATTVVAGRPISTTPARWKGVDQRVIRLCT